MDGSFHTCRLTRVILSSMTLMIWSVKNSACIGSILFSPSFRCFVLFCFVLFYFVSFPIPAFRLYNLPNWRGCNKVHQQTISALIHHFPGLISFKLSGFAPPSLSLGTRSSTYFHHLLSHSLPHPALLIYHHYLIPQNIFSTPQQLLSMPYYTYLIIHTPY